MRVFPIGVGTAFGRRFFNSNLIVEFDSQEFLLVDCGMTASRSLETIGLSVLDVKNLFVSHLHADHIGGIEELTLKNKLLSDSKTNLYINERLIDGLWQSIRGGIEFTQWGRMTLDDYFNLFPYRDSFVIKGVEFSSQPTHHVEGMLSFDLGFGNILLTGDTVFRRDYVVGRASDFETVVHDCSFDDVQKVHAYYKELIENRDLFNRLFIIHYEDHIARHKQRLLSADIDICRQYTDIA